MYIQILLGVLVVALLFTNLASVCFYRKRIKILEQIKSIYFQMYRREKRIRARDRKVYETDQLTGLISADGYRQKIERLMNIPHRRYGDQEWVIVLAVIDLDKLKLINDRYGHLFGNRVLKEYARLLKEELFRRPEDLVIRSSRRGDEFMVVTQCLEDDVIKVERRLRKAQSINVVTNDGVDVKITASIGFSRIGNGIESAIEEADHNMYVEKRRHALQVVRK